jgi:PAS domain S-box-containing protein
MYGFTPGPHRLATPVGVMWGTDDRMTAADDALLAIIGYTREDLEAGRLDWRTLTPPEYMHLDEAGKRQAAETGGFALPYQKEFIRKDGSRVPVLLCCAFVPGVPGGWTGHVVDLSIRTSPPPPPQPHPGSTPIPPVTEEFHRRLIGELVNERTSMLAMLDSSPSLIWAIDREFRLIGCNSVFQHAARRTTGRMLEIGDPVLSDAIPHTMQIVWKALYDRALGGERVTQFGVEEFDGVQYWYDYALAPMRNTSGEVYGVTCSAHDARERLASDEALRASESRFRTLAASSPLGILLTDVTGAVIYTNERLQAIWGMPEAEMLGFGPAQRLHPDDFGRVQQSWRLAVAESRDMQLEFRLLMPDASVRIVRAWFSCLYEQGRMNGFVASIEDATDAHALAQSTRQRERLESLGTLAGGIAHDFNNMLGIVLGYTELGLTDRKLPASLAADLQEIRTASLRARDLVRQILTFSRHSDASHSPVDFAALTRESVRLLRAALPAHVDIDVHIPEHQVTVLGNASALQQVIVNLCVNAEHALRHADHPRIAITLDRATASGAPVVVLRIQDNGHGMPSEIADRVFEPFFTTKKIGEGSGMGLAVVHGTILAHGGTISVDTAPNRGTTFTVRIPACETAVAPDDVTEHRTRGSGHILLVEDEPQLAAAVAASLRRAGFQVSTCHNGEDAMRLLDDAPSLPHVVVSDVSMPGLTGDRLAALLETRYPALPVVLMTGYSERVTPDGPRGPNVIAVMQKPVSSSALASVLDHVLN